MRRAFIDVAHLLLVVAVLLPMGMPTMARAQETVGDDYDANLVARLVPNGLTADSAIAIGDGNYSLQTASAVVVAPQNLNDGLVVQEYDSHPGLTIAAGDGYFTGEAQTEGNTVIYRGDNAYALVDAFDGGVRELFYLSNDRAPRSYVTNYTSSNLDHMAFATDSGGNADGSVILYSDADENAPLAYVPQPWAKDATGKTVGTHYEISGNSLVQVIEPDSETTYPVVADPTTIYTFFSSVSWIYRSPYWSLSLVPNAWMRATAGLGTAGGLAGASVGEIVARQAWNQIYAHEHSNTHWRDKNVNGMFNQYECHFHFAFWKSAFNLEPDRPNPGLAKTITQMCNPS